MRAFFAVQKSLTDRSRGYYSCLRIGRSSEMNPEALNFATTHWSVVLAAAQADSPQAAAALEQLCRTYWYPLYAFVRRQGHNPQDAEDLLQAFFARFLEKNYLDEVDRSQRPVPLLPAGGAEALPRRRMGQGPGRPSAAARCSSSRSTQAAESRYWEEPASDLTPEKLYEQRWACVLLER